MSGSCTFAFKLFFYHVSQINYHKSSFLNLRKAGLTIGVLGAKKRYWPEISDNSRSRAFGSQRKCERAPASVFSSSPDNGTKAALQCYIIAARKTFLPKPDTAKHNDTTEQNTMECFVKDAPPHHLTWKRRRNLQEKTMENRDQFVKTLSMPYHFISNESQEKVY